MSKYCSRCGKDNFVYYCKNCDCVHQDNNTELHIQYEVRADGFIEKIDELTKENKMLQEQANEFPKAVKMLGERDAIIEELRFALSAYTNGKGGSNC